MGNQIAVITSIIRTIRGKKVLLDEDLAQIYGVPTKRLNEQVKRNLKEGVAKVRATLTLTVECDHNCGVGHCR
jgi:hypothetical protein